MAERITITVAAGGDDAEARAFGAALKDILDILESLEEKAVWRIVAMEKRSPPSMTIESRRDAGIGKRLVSGLQKLEGEVANPFPPRAMRAVRRLASRLRDRRLDSVILNTNPTPTSEGMSVAPTARMYDYVTRAMAAKNYSVPSSIDGKLDVVNIHVRPRFSIFDDIGMQEVRCHFPDRLLDEVRKSLGKRVTVVGDVKFSAETDRPISIRVDEIIPLEDETVKPKLFSEMHAIDMTGDLSSEEYIRRLRDGGGQ